MVSFWQKAIGHTKDINKKMKIKLFFIAWLASASLCAQHIDTGRYIIKGSQFGGCYFTFLNDTDVLYCTYGCGSTRQGKGIYAFTDSQLVITLFQHPDDTLVTYTTINLTGNEQNDSIEVSLKLLSIDGDFVNDLDYSIIAHDTFNIWRVEDSNKIAHFKIAVSNLPCKVMCGSSYGHTSFSTYLQKPFNSDIIIHATISDIMGWANPYYEAGMVVAFPVKDVSANGFTYDMGGKWQYRFEKDIKQ
jgi:hypothetical protein